jgi:hypothetical protein
MKRAFVGAALFVAAFAVNAPVAHADRGGLPQENSCGLGRVLSEEARAEQTRPGASEIRDFPPNECRGN